MFKHSLRFPVAALTGIILSASCLLSAPVEAQNRIPDYGNMVQTGEMRVTGFVDKLAFTPDSKIVVASEKDHFLTWNSDTGEPIRIIQGPENIRSNFILFTPDGQTMITSGSDAAIRVWNFKTGEVTQTLEGHRGAIIGLALSQSGKLLASSSADRTIRIWDIETGKQVHELTGVVYPASMLVFSEDEKKLTTFGGIGGIGSTNDLKRTEIWQWNVESGEPEEKDILADFAPPYALTADGTALIGYGEVKTQVSSTKFNSNLGLRRYSITNKEFGSDILDASHFGYIFNCIRIAPNKAVLAIATDRSYTDGSTPGIKLWNGRTPSAGLPRIPVASATMEFSPDSRKIVTWRDELKVKIFTAP